MELLLEIGVVLLTIFYTTLIYGSLLIMVAGFIHLLIRKGEWEEVENDVEEAVEWAVEKWTGPKK